MFNSFTKYRQRRTQTKEHASVLADVVLTVLEPHYNNFLNTVEPTLRSMGDDVLFRAPTYYETQEAHEPSSKLSAQQSSPPTSNYEMKTSLPLCTVSDGAES